MTYTSMTIFGQLVEQVYTVPSDDGIGPTIQVCMIRNHGAGDPNSLPSAGLVFDGLPIIWSSPSLSQPTLIRRRLASKFGSFNVGLQDRGILKTAVTPIITAQTTINTVTSNLAAAALTDAMATVTGTRVPQAVFQASVHAVTILPLITPLIQNSFALANAVFALGTVTIGQTAGLAPPLLSQTALYANIDTDHALGLGGVYGTASSISAAGTFCVAYQTIAEQNHVAMTTGYGPVQSRYIYNAGASGANFPGPDTSGKTIVLDLVTYLTPSQPSTTFGYISVHCGDS
jgi:hypothetical protein